MGYGIAEWKRFATAKLVVTSSNLITIDHTLYVTVYIVTWTYVCLLTR